VDLTSRFNFARGGRSPLLWQYWRFAARGFSWNGNLAVGRLWWPAAWSVVAASGLYLPPRRAVFRAPGHCPLFLSGHLFWWKGDAKPKSRTGICRA